MGGLCRPSRCPGCRVDGGGHAVHWGGGCTLYAGRFANDDDLQSRFRASVNAILESGRLPSGAQMGALGKHFRAVHIVALR